LTRQGKANNALPDPLAGFKVPLRGGIKVETKMRWGKRRKEMGKVKERKMYGGGFP